jgi:two-component system sensor histidine kinase KdpD
MVIAAGAVCWLLQSVLRPSNLSLIFLTAVLFSALRYGLWPSIFAALLSDLAWNFFFLPPRFTLAIDDPRDLLALVLFIIVSLAVGNLTALQKRQAEVIRAGAEATNRLYEFSQEIAAVGSLDTLLAVACRTIGAMLGIGVAMAVSDDDGEVLLAADAPGEVNRDIVLREMANLSAENRADGPWRSVGDRDGDTRCHVRRLVGRAPALIAITGSPASIPADRQWIATMLLQQTTVAIERLQLAKSVEKASLQAEMEHLRSAMLTSLSHDLRTPLTVIIAAHSALKTLAEPIDAVTREELLDRAQAEAERLDRFIGNLLDMTQLESGRLNMHLGPVDVADAIEAAVDRAGPLLTRHTLDIDLPDDLPIATGDFMLLEQVIFNLLDNAAKYAPPPSTIRIAGTSRPGSVMIEIVDEGPGFPPDASRSIFDKFTRLRQEDRRLPGTGLGLAICRGFLAAMGGDIAAGNRDDRPGAIFTVTLGAAAPLPIATLSA